MLIRSCWRACVLVASLCAASLALAQGPVTLRIATFNIEDVSTGDLADPSHPRLKRLAEVLQRLRPNIVLINEIAYDLPGGPGVPADATPGRNAQRFADSFLAVSQGEGLAPLRFKAVMPQTNTGMPSGLDLDNDGKVITTFPPLGPNRSGGRPAEQTAEGRAYGNDCWGFGTYPGQYAMALLVDERLEVLNDKVRTFRRLPWEYVPGAMLPPSASGASGEFWYDAEELKVFRLSSKTHADIPVKLPGGAVVHFLCSHPTPPAFDGEEKRNARRNHDEIRFWADYLDNEPHIVDDASVAGGIAFRASFVILGDLNADPDEGSSFKNPIDLLLSHRLVAKAPAPVGATPVTGLDADDTAMFGLRVDYVLPSKDLETLASGVWREAPSAGSFPSDHFPVWADIRVPAPKAP